MSSLSDALRRCGGGALVAAVLASGMSALAQKPPAPAVDRGPLPAPKVTVNRTAPTVAPPRRTFAFSARPTVDEIFAARAFREPLVPVGGTPTDAETAALALALLAFTRGTTAGSVDVFDTFLAAYPATPWRASLQLNIGARYRTAGAWSSALAAWEEAWTLARHRDDASSRAVADLAVGEWLLLNAQLGRSAVVAARTEELRDRPMRGTAAVKVGDAREIAAMTRLHPDKVISSGPQALLSVLAELKVAAPAALLTYRPTAAGVSLLQLRDLSRASSHALRMVRRVSGTDVPVPSIVHWKVNHYAAVVEQQGEQFRILDRGMGGSYWLSRELLREETSGYFLVPKGAAGLETSPAAWVDVDDATAATIVGFSCPPGGPPPNDCNDCCSAAGGGAGGGSNPGGGGGCNGAGCGGMVRYQFHAVSASLRLLDTPVGYQPPQGPSVYFRLTYHQRDALQPQIFTASHLGPKWMADWFRYLQEEPADVYGINPPHVWVLLAGGGREVATGPTGGVYLSSWRTKGVIVKVSEAPLRYERRLRDGTVEVFAAPDSAPAGQRRVYLTQIIDPQQQAVTLTWDAQQRLVAITDAIGQVTTLTYDDGADARRLTSVTDPFARAATFTYNAAGQLESITDVLGLVSRMAYGSEDFVSALTTPYGTTTFRREHFDEFVNRFVEATDPLGGTERIEFRWNTTAIPPTEPTTEVPAGFTAFNAGLDDFNTVYWDKLAWARSPGDVAAATTTRWVVASELPAMPAYSAGVPHSVKRALESRVWYAYPGQASPGSAGTWAQPSAVGRVVDDGASQVAQTIYNAQGSVLTRTDPLGRQTTSSYAANGIDLLEVRQTTGGVTDLLATQGNYVNHRPQTVTDGAGQPTTLSYNAAGQALTTTNAKSETTTYTYEPTSGRLTAVTGPVTGATTTYTYDAYGRVRTVTDADSATVTTDYDLLDRPIRTTYPDGTYDATTYERLDIATRRDRAGRVTRFYYDALARLVGTRDPAGRLVGQEWCACGSLEALVDANGHRTTWERDLGGRLIREVRADGVTDTVYTYGARTGRLLTVTDPKDQVTTYTYALDDRVLTTVFTDAVIPTPSVTFTYDAAYGRVATMVDGTGTTTYAYKAVGHLGAGQVASVDGPLQNDTITYGYDELGRVTTRAINGAANTVTWAFDALGRVTSEVNLLGTFTYTYDGPTARVATVTHPNNQTSTYGYLPTLQDHRLQTIHHKYPSGATLSKFDYTYDVVGNILTWRQQANATAVLWRYGYDAVDQLTAATKYSTDATPVVLKRYGYAYDPAGNRTAEQIDDVVTGASHDVLNRLLSHQPAGPVVFAGTVNEPAAVTVQGVPAVVGTDNAFRAAAPVAAGTNTVTITATDASGNVATEHYQVPSSGAATTFTYDANGNLASDGPRTFEWDARNQLVAITVGTHRSEFSYDGEQHRVRIIEKENGLTQSDIQVVWCEKEICEERAADGVTVMRRPFGLGEQVAGATRFFASDHLGSVTDVTETSSGLVARYAFDPWGRRTLAAGADITGVGFTGHQWHSTGAVWLARFRAYDEEVGRWASEDPFRLVDGPAFYVYVGNNPMRWVDAEGLFKTTSQTTSANSVTCDGSGNTTLKIVTNNPCIRDCVVAHERSHQRDINSRNPGICKGVKAGTHIGPDDDAERRWTERRSCRAELDCLKRKLQNASCDCKSDIENRIKQMNTWCAQWGK